MEAGTAATPRAGNARTSNNGTHVDRARRLATETKQAFKTSEFWMTVALVVGILISAAMINGGDTSGGDEFIARDAWLYVAILGGAYAIGRGLAKSGSNDPYTEERDDRS